jgi:hypothetical protein
MICRTKEQGGLGMEVLGLTNRCLLSKWMFKLLTEARVCKPTYSPFWNSLIRVKDDFLNRGFFKAGSGHLVRF